MNGTVVKPNDILLNITGASIGRSCVVPHDFDEGNVNQHVCIIRNKTEIVNQNFLQSFISSTIGQNIIFKSQVGGNREGLNHSNIRNISFPSPPLPEQKAIASCLSTWDKAIELQDKKIKLLEKRKNGLMQQLLQPNTDWEKLKLGEVANFRRGSFPQPYGLSKWYDDKNGYNFVQVFDVDFNMKLKPTTKRKISSLATEQSVFVEKETIVVTIQGSIGRVALTQYETYIDRTLLIFTSFNYPINKIFFIHIIDNLFKIEKEKAPGGTIKTITKEVLKNFTINIPSLEKQTAIANILQTADKEIELEKTKLEKLKDEKKGMMQQLLTGKKRLKH